MTAQARAMAPGVAELQRRILGRDTARVRVFMQQMGDALARCLAAAP